MHASAKLLSRRRKEPRVMHTLAQGRALVPHAAYAGVLSTPGSDAQQHGVDNWACSIHSLCKPADQ